MVTDIWNQKKIKNERASITILENMATAGCDQNGKHDFEKETNTRGNKWRFKEFHQNTSQPQMSIITHQHKHTLKQVTQTTVLSEVTQWKFFWFYFGIHPVWAQSPLTATQRPLPLWISLGSTPVRPTRFCWTNIETVCHEQDHQLQRWSPGQRTRLVCPVSAGWCGTKQRTTN